MFDPDEKPRAFITLLVAAGRFIFQGCIPKQAFDDAEGFVAEAERRLGSFDK